MRTACDRAMKTFSGMVSLSLEKSNVALMDSSPGLMTTMVSGGAVVPYVLFCASTIRVKMLRRPRRARVDIQPRAPNIQYDRKSLGTTESWHSSYLRGCVSLNPWH